MHPRSLRESKLATGFNINLLGVDTFHASLYLFLYLSIHLFVWDLSIGCLLFPNNVKNPVRGFSSSMSKVLECVQ